MLDPEEAKANAASRRASRTRESSVVPLEDLGKLYITNVHRLSLKLVEYKNHFRVSCLKLAS